MEVLRKMEIPTDYLFDVFKQSIESDILTQTGKSLTEDDFTGFEYVKEFSKDTRAIIHIEKYERGNAYYYSTHTDKNKISVKYDVRSIDEYNSELRYTEKIISYGYLQKLNDTFIGLVWGFLKKRRFKEILNQIEQSYTE
jgi:hypothetical protein